MRRRVIRRGAQAVALVGALGVVGAAHAAGGHHSVDDAAILEPGQCEVEGWFTRTSAIERVFHAGVGCRVGPVELGLAAERARDPAGTGSGYGLQVKWATQVAQGVSVGLSLSAGWQAHVRPRYQASTVAALLTWKPHEDWSLHANVGRDLVHRAPDENRAGVAVEWAPADKWSLMAERYVESTAHLVRAGVRWAAMDNLTVDLSRAHLVRGPGASSWTLGATWTFERR